MRKKMMPGLLGMMIIAPAPLAAQSTAVVTTTRASIGKILSDWNLKALLVKIDSSEAIVNPAGCTLVDAYETNPTDAGIDLNHSMLITAYVSKNPVALNIQGCSVGGRPRIVGVEM